MKAFLIVGSIIGVACLYAWNTEECKKTRAETKALRERNRKDAKELGIKI